MLFMIFDKGERGREEEGREEKGEKKKKMQLLTIQQFGKSLRIFLSFEGFLSTGRWKEKKKSAQE